jgi:hypothetical protein
LQTNKRHTTPQAAGGAPPGVPAIGPAKFVVGAPRRLDWTWSRLVRWARRLLVVTGARCPLSNAQSPRLLLSNNRQPLSPMHCSRGMQPGGICVSVVQREPALGGPPGCQPDLGPVLPPLVSAACRLAVLGPQNRRPVWSSRHVPIERKHMHSRQQRRERPGYIAYWLRRARLLL